MADTVAAFRSKIAPELQGSARPIEDCQPHPDNARKHNLPRIAKSLNDHGQRTPIVVQASTGYIVKGNGTWTAAAQILGWTEIAQVWQDLDDDQALQYLLADNKASDEAGYDTPKLVKALNKLVEGPGLMETLWNNEELEDLIEAEEGIQVLEGAEVSAEFADAAYHEERAARGAASGEKHKEVPLVMTVADHAKFVERLNVLRKRYGINGTVATVVEAVRRQAEAEEGAERVGRDLNAEEVRRIRRELVVELRDLILTDPRYEQPSRVAIVALLEAAQPQANPSPLRAEEVAEGQIEAFPDLADPTPPPPEAPAEEVPEDLEAQLAAYRKQMER